MFISFGFSGVSTNFRTLDLNLLRVFDMVMAEGSLSRAAAALSVTQPAISHAVRRLRDAFDDEVFVRTAHGVQPTPRALALWPHVHAALASLRQAVAPGDFDPQRDAVHLRLTMADATAALLAPPLIAAIERQRALASLRILPLSTRDPRRTLQADEADLAIGSFPDVLPVLRAEGADSLFRHQPLYETRYVCVMRRDHPLAAAPLTLDAYCAAHHLLVSFSGRPFGAVDQALAALGLSRRIVLTVNQFFTAGRVVARSDLVTVLPASFLEATGYRAELETRELPFALPTVRVGMLWHLRHDADPAHRWLREQLRQGV